MAKLLRLRDKLLVGLALAGDYILPALFRAARGLPPYKLPSWSGNSSQGRPYKKQTFYNEVSRLLRTGEIEKIIIRGQPFLRITNCGEKRLSRDFPFLKLQRKNWNGFWCLVIFDLPEKERKVRDYLRDKLLELNFGMLQQSVYISPYDFSADIAQYLNDKKLLGYAFVLTAPHKFMGSARSLANRVWQLEDFNQHYLDIIDKVDELSEQKSIEHQEVAFLKQQFLELISEDPFLPKELLPVDWGREEAYQEIVKVENLIVKLLR